MKINVAKYVLRGFNYLIWTAAFGLLTVFYWYVSNGNLLTAYTLNVIGISAALIIEKQRVSRIYKQLKLCTDGKARAKLAKKDLTSLKTSLYLFYIFAMIASHVVSMALTIEVSEQLKSYFRVVEHGLIILFAIDTFLKQLLDDDKRIKMFQTECEGRND